MFHDESVFLAYCLARIRRPPKKARQLSRANCAEIVPRTPTTYDIEEIDTRMQHGSSEGLGSNDSIDILGNGDFPFAKARITKLNNLHSRVLALLLDAYYNRGIGRRQIPKRGKNGPMRATPWGLWKSEPTPRTTTRSPVQ